MLLFTAVKSVSPIVGSAMPTMISNCWSQVAVQQSIVSDSHVPPAPVNSSHPKTESLSQRTPHAIHARLLLQLQQHAEHPSCAHNIWWPWPKGRLILSCKV